MASSPQTISWDSLKEDYPLLLLNLHPDEIQFKEIAKATMKEEFAKRQPAPRGAEKKLLTAALVSIS
jgi:hypothetical protein